LHRHWTRQVTRRTGKATRTCKATRTGKAARAATSETQQTK